MMEVKHLEKDANRRVPDSGRFLSSTLTAVTTSLHLLFLSLTAAHHSPNGS